MSEALKLREATEADEEALFLHQQDPESRHMAAFVSANPSDREAFSARWKRMLADASIRKLIILHDGEVAGHILSWEEAGQREVTYWLGREFWGRGFATRALAAFLQLETRRPLRARVAKDNVASLRVLQKCGFAIVGQAKGFAEGRGCEIEEHILSLP